jgi:hypothetical protein
MREAAAGRAWCRLDGPFNPPTCRTIGSPPRPRRDGAREPPEVVAVGQLRELPPDQARAQAVEGAQRRVFLVAGGVVDPTARGPQPRPRQVHHPREIAFPQRLRRRQVAGLHPGDPSHDRAFAVARHEWIPEVDVLIA